MKRILLLTLLILSGTLLRAQTGTFRLYGDAGYELMTYENTQHAFAFDLGAAHYLSDAMFINIQGHFASNADDKDEYLAGIGPGFNLWQKNGKLFYLSTAFGYGKAAMPPASDVMIYDEEKKEYIVQPGGDRSIEGMSGVATLGFLFPLPVRNLRIGTGVNAFWIGFQDHVSLSATVGLHWNW